MHIFKGIGPLKAHLKLQISPETSIGLVPTMGALHNGHLSLIKTSKKENTLTICSVYVNPTQFNNPADLEKYPRTIENDFRLLKEADCDIVFCPDSSEMYPEPSQIKFDFGSLDKILEGEFRPGHFSGVALVVSKLFHIIQPDRAYFGQKDFQQFKIVSRMTEELKFNLSLVCMPIVREADGLAMSSRNARLNERQRKQSGILYQCLKDTRQRLLQGEPFPKVKNEMRDRCDQGSVRLEYLAMADRNNFSLLETMGEPQQAILLIAAYVGDVRLIDNLFLQEPVQGN